jgi:hypothetical protein
MHDGQGADGSSPIKPEVHMTLQGKVAVATAITIFSDDGTTQLRPRV